MAEPKPPYETIDLTPTWEGILPGLLLLTTNYDPQVRANARRELEKMARTADRFVASTKEPSPQPLGKALQEPFK